MLYYVTCIMWFEKIKSTSLIPKRSFDSLWSKDSTALNINTFKSK